jgi:MATE family multidrug resistance protein
MGAGAESGAFAADYFRIRIWGAPLFFATMAANAWFHGRGDMGTPMVGTLISNAVNIALDPLLIFGWAAFPALGVRGAALATVIGFACGAAYVVARMSRDLAGVSLRLQRRVFAALWKLGCPIGVRYFLDVASFQVFAILLAWVGDVHLAAHIIVVRIISVSFLPGYAVGEATGVLTGMATGAERPEAAREAYRAGVRLGVAIMLAAAVVFVLMPELLLSVFSPAPEVLEVGRMLLLIGAGFQIFDALVMVAGGALNGAGDTRFAMWVSVSCAWFVKLPLGYVLTIVGGYGAVGAWLGLGAEIFALSGLLVFRVSGSAWLRHRAVADVAA